MEWIRGIFGLIRKTDKATLRAQRIARIETLGFRLVDQRGWHEGEHWRRRYLLVQNEEIIGGPYLSSKEATRAAEDLAARASSPKRR